MNLARISLLAALFASFAVSQTPDFDPAAAVSGGCGLQTEDGYLLGAGSDYRVVFDADGITFTPALGRQAPAEMPWRFSLDSIERGEDVVYARDAGSAVNPTRSGLRASFTRTRDITERYDVRSEGVEQSFVFGCPLPGQGDLVVRGKIDSDLENRFRGESSDGLAFACAFGEITVGGVTGIDAVGRRVAGTLRYDGDSMELVLPAAFVDEAVYPLVLDPLIGFDWTVGASLSEDTDADVAWGGSPSAYTAVWTRPYSAGTADVLGQRFTESGWEAGFNMHVIAAAGNNVRPSIASSKGSRRFLCVWENRPTSGGGGSSDLWMRAINDDGSMSNTVTLAATGADEVDPDVGNETRYNAESVLVVWNRVGFGIRCAEVSIPDGFADPSLSSTVKTVSSSALDSDPAVSKGCGSDEVHAVVWTREAVTGNNVLGAAVSHSGTLLGNEIPIAAFVDRGEQRADVDGDGESFLAVFECDEGPGSTDADVCCRRLRYDGSSLVTDGPRIWIDDDPSQHEAAPAVGLAMEKYVIAWSEASAAAARDLRGVELRASDLSPCGGEFLIEGPRNRDVMPEIATQFVAGDSSSGEAMITFTSLDLGANGGSQVQAQRYSAFGGGAVTTIHAECGGGGQLTIRDQFALLNTVEIDLDLADGAATLATLHIGTDASPVVPCGSCSILTPLVAVPIMLFYFDDFAYGDVDLDLPDCSSGLHGSVWRFQYVVANTTETPCLGLPVGLSNIEEAVLDY